MSNSRTRNVSRNMTVALICQITNLIISFIARTIFIQTLGVEYLGVNGLFGNILTILSFAELGIGNALLYSMYKPLADGDKLKLCSLLKLYKKAYTVIGLVVGIAGFAVMPFLKFIIKDTPNIPENLYLLYFLFLLNTILSYAYVYKKSIIIADQKNWIVLLSKQGGHILMTIFQILVLLFTHNFILFLVLQFTFTLLENVVTAKIADKKYPYILEDSEELPNGERKAIFANVKSMAFYKFGSVILNSTDNIIVSSLVNLTTVGLVSNYVLLHGACNSILANIANAFTASIGNLNATGTPEQKYKIFQRLLFITAWMFGFASMGLIVLTKDFITVWVGEDYVLEMIVVIGIMSEFYIQGLHTAECTYRITSGLFVKGKYAPLAGSILNLILSFVLFKFIGLAGIFFATPIARMATIGIVDTLLIYKHVFHKSPILYYVTNALYLALFALFAFISYLAISEVSMDGWIGVVIKCIVFSIVFNGCIVIVFWRTRIFKDLRQSLKMVILKR